MSFFFTEEGTGAAGANLGGLAGADAKCQAAAAAVGAGGRTWRAYLSADNDATYGRVDARDRIGTGPWFNYNGTMIGTLESIHFENGGNGIAEAHMFSECGFVIDQQATDLFSRAHDILTGSTEFGTLQGGTGPGDPPRTCEDWTSNDPNGFGWVGHEHEEVPYFWNNAHPTDGCDQAGLATFLGIGRLYCFAID